MQIASSSSSTAVGKPDTGEKEASIPAVRVGDIADGERTVTADTDLRDCRTCGHSDE